VRINRGRLSLEEIAEKALEVDAEKVMVVDRWEKGAGKIEFFEVVSDGLRIILPAVYLRSMRFRRDFGEQMPSGRRIESIAIAAASKENFEIKKFEDVLSRFFRIPVLSLEEAANDNWDVVMQFLIDYSERAIITFRLIPEHIEIGPRIEISHLVWELM
jgi:rRNA maturation protein Rpf1